MTVIITFLSVVAILAIIFLLIIIIGHIAILKDMLTEAEEEPKPNGYGDILNALGSQDVAIVFRQNGPQVLVLLIPNQEMLEMDEFELMHKENYALASELAELLIERQKEK